MLNAAAQRRRIHLDWVFAPEGPEIALKAGRVDLWPVLGDIPARQGRFFITAPVQKMTYLLVLAADSRYTRPDDLAGQRLAITPIAIERRLAQERFPRSPAVEVARPSDTVVAVCEGRAAAAIVGQNSASASFPDCRKTLTIVPLPDGTIRFGVSALRSRKDAVRTANVLRDEIGKMAHDGTLAAIDFRWATNLANEVGALSDATASHRYATLLLCALIIVAIATGVLVVLTRRLRVVQRQAVAANRAKSEFLANMSHEVRTPLHGILGMTSLALEKCRDSEQREYLGTVKDSACSLLSIVNDVLDFSRIEAGKLELDPAPFEVRPFLGQILRAFEITAFDKGLRLNYEIAVDVPRVLNGDSHRLRQVIVNLVGNSLKFTAEGQIKVQFTQGRLSEDGSRCEFLISVTDTGIGIPEHQQKRILEPFTQADASMTRKYGGTGLGLTICAKLAVLMGGDLRLRSTPGVGSTVSFSAWLGLNGAPTAPASPRTVESHTSRRALRILLAEDNLVNQRLAKRLLEKNGHEVLIANNGLEAVALFKEQNAEVILMDVQMPELDGTEATVRIREIERTLNLRRTPIIAVTAHAMEADRQHCLDAGMDAYLSKPLDVSALLQMIDHTTSGSQTSTAIHST
jgi:signal transduction histidine kinase/CheY-like chemotaxis protein